MADKPMLYANFTTLSFIELELLPIKVLHDGNREFRVFAKNSGNYYKIFFAPQKGRNCRWNTFSDPLSTVLACMLPVLHAFKVLFYAESVGVGVVTRRLVTYFRYSALYKCTYYYYYYFRSRDKDGGHAIRSAMADNPMLYANFTTLSFTEPKLLPIEVLHDGNREFRVFFAKNSGNY